MSIKSKKPLKACLRWQGFVLSMLMPLSPILFLFQQNAAEVQLRYMLLIYAAYAIIAMLAYVAGAVIYRSSLSGLACALMMTVLLVLVRPIHAEMLRLSKAWSVQFRYVALLFLVPAAALFAWLAAWIRKLPSITEKILAVFVCVLAMMNIVPTALSLRSRQTDEVTKTAFVTDKTLPSPNIYVIIMDGAMGLDAFDRYYNNETLPFRARMEEQGFILNASAALDAKHSTSIVMPTLFCPQFYDAYLQNTLSEHPDMERDPFMAAFADPLNSAHCNNELLRAFREKGYHTYTIAGGYEPFSSMLTDRFYRADHHIYDSSGDIYSLTTEDMPYSIDYNFNPDESKGLGLLKALSLVVPEFLAVRTDIGLSVEEEKAFFETLRSVPDTLSEEQLELLFDGNAVAMGYYAGLMQCMEETIAAEGPKVIQLHNLMLHLPYGIQNADYIKEPWPDGEEDLPDFEGHYLYTLQALANTTEHILAADPGAIIVVQGDHGIHGEWYEGAIASRFGADAIPLFQDSTLSGIRVPPAYRDDALSYATSDPRNIVRWLVNRFVGDNYAYIQTEP